MKTQLSNIDSLSEDHISSHFNRELDRMKTDGKTSTNGAINHLLNNQIDDEQIRELIASNLNEGQEQQVKDSENMENYPESFMLEQLSKLA